MRQIKKSPGFHGISRYFAIGIHLQIFSSGGAGRSRFTLDHLANSPFEHFVQCRRSISTQNQRYIFRQVCLVNKNLQEAQYTKIIL